MQTQYLLTPVYLWPTQLTRPVLGHFAGGYYPSGSDSSLSEF